MPKQTEQFHAYMSDFLAVCRGTKPLVIVSEGKSPEAFDLILKLAREQDLRVIAERLRCEDGFFYDHLLVSVSRVQDAGEMPRRGMSVADRARHAILDCKEGAISRLDLQYELGVMLGYDEKSIREFMVTDTARTCPCDCCGGSFVADGLYNK